MGPCGIIAKGRDEDLKGLFMGILVKNVNKNHSENIILSVSKLSNH